MCKLEAFKNKLELYRKPKSDDPYDDRTTHCYLYFTYKDKEHCFEVRGWGDVKDEKLVVYVVNWTLCAGYASLTLNKSNVDFYIIEEAYR